MHIFNSGEDGVSFRAKSIFADLVRIFNMHPIDLQRAIEGVDYIKIRGGHPSVWKGKKMPFYPKAPWTPERKAAWAAKMKGNKYGVGHGRPRKTKGE